MAKLAFKAGSTSKTVQVFIQDSSVTTGAGLTGLAYNTASLVASYVQPGASRAAITLATLAAANSAWSSGGFKEIDSTNCPGLYRLDIPDACLTGANHVTIHLKGATSMVPCLLEIELVAYDPQDTMRLGLTALPNAAAEAAGGLYTRGTGAGQINQDANGRVDVSLKAILGTTLTETAGQIAAAFKKFFDKASPTGTVNSIPDAVAGANGGLPTVDASNRIAGVQGTTKHTLDDLNDLSAAGIRAAIGMASANLDTQIATLATLTKLLKYVQLLARKDAAIATDNATELTAINANGGSGAGSFDNTTDAEQALRDRGDAAWITATGFSILDAAGVRSAVGLASANLDTQLGAIDDYIDTEVAAIKAKTDLIVDLTATRAEPGQTAPNATLDPLTKLDFLYKAWRNKKEKTATASKLYNSTGSVVDQKTTDSDDGTTGTRGVQSAGP